MEARSDHSGDTQLIAVYETLEQAYAAAERAQAAGAPQAFVDRPGDRVDSLRAEMRDELEHALISPTAVLVLPKESAKGVGALAPIGMVVGALLALPWPGSTGACRSRRVSSSCWPAGRRWAPRWRS